MKGDEPVLEYQKVLIFFESSSPFPRDLLIKVFTSKRRRYLRQKIFKFRKDLFLLNKISMCFSSQKGCVKGDGEKRKLCTYTVNKNYAKTNFAIIMGDD